MARRAEPITKRTAKNGTVAYEFRVDVGTRLDGGRQRERFTYRTLAEARREYRRITTEVAAGTYVTRHRVTVAEFLTEWLDGRRDVRAVTLTNYRNHLRPVIDKLGTLGLQQLTKTHVDELVAWRTESGRAPTRRLSDRAARILEWIADRPGGVTYAQVESEFGTAGAKYLDRLRDSGHVSRPKRGTYVAVPQYDTDERRGVGATTIRAMLTVLSAALDDAMAQGLTARNVARLVERPKIEAREMAAWSAADAEQFRNYVENEREFALWALTLYGLRRSEVFGLRWDAVDLDAGTVTIKSGRVYVPGTGVIEGDPKSTRSRRVLPMPADVIAALKSFKATQAAERLVIGPGWPDTGLVAVNADGTPIHPDTYSAEFTRLAKAAGVPSIRLHDARHTSVSLMMARGVPVLDVAKWHGHDPAMTLRVYGHTDGDALARAGAALFGTQSAAQ